MSTYVYMYVYLWTFSHLSVYLHVYRDVCMHFDLSMYLFMNLDMCLLIYMHMSMYVYGSKMNFTPNTKNSVNMNMSKRTVQKFNENQNEQKTVELR